MKYTIKTFIKEKNETVSTVANKLHLSRPTFDTYIMIYESGEPLPKKLYQKVFDSLFSDYRISSEAFKERLDICEEVLLTKTNSDSIDFLSRRADRAARLMNQIRQNIDYENFDEELYEFINLVITNYSDDVIYNLVQFFLMLYGKKDTVKATNLQIAYFSELFHALEKLNAKEIHFSYSDWKRYQEKCEKARISNELGSREEEQERLKQIEEELRRQLYGNTIWGLEF